MNGPMGRRSVASAVTIAVIALLMTYVFPATATTYKETRGSAVASSGQLSAFNPLAVIPSPALYSTTY